ncbi:cysteine--tRNA ligase [Methylocystis sp.]|uniref:cysteine--tRNA ligase n=1 Tax=Methylocystis sp. TaxID=1911079 RepID=UPI003DA45DED
MSTPALKIYNTLTRTKEEFRPIDPAHVRMYVCGPTVYDYAHIGNARPLIVFDVLFRLLRHLYGAEHVAYVRNITDVDDKINARAFERGISIRELTDETNKVFQQDVKALGCLEPTVQPRATEHIAQMVAIIERLIASGHAYAADGHVLFDVPSMQNYGRLSRRSLDEMLAGARVDVAPYKRGDMDFVLWKPSKENEPGWDSPWGRGRPGWHIECSAMSWAHLGETFDIHGGGIDLVFPHHENEIAQSCCAFGRDVMANYWMHNGFLQVEGEKMSKSLGNFVTIHELLHTEKFGGRKWPGEVLRLAMLRTHYRQPIDWTVKALEEAEKTLDRWYSLLDETSIDLSAKPDDSVLEALADDLNTPLAISHLHSIFWSSRGTEYEQSIAKRGWDIHDSDAASMAVATAKLMGLLTSSPAEWKRSVVEGAGVNANVVSSLVSERLAARASKNWAESDRIRDELAAMGIILKDHKDGATTWEVKR